jgi:CHAT domain-containing protein
MTVTRERARVDRLGELATLEPGLVLFQGLVARRDGAEAPAARALFGRWLGAALDRLEVPPSRLIVVPDGALFELPFEALRDPRDAAGRPLGAAVEVAVVPSVTTWLAARRAEVAPPARAALVLADPRGAAPRPLAGAHGSGGEGAAFGELGALPGARREGRRILRRLGAGSELRSGERATEGVLSRPDLGSFAVLHLAAHAVADARRPRRSAVHLAAAGPREDGLLQWREIAELPLAGRLVMLSACRSAAGALGEGEGPMSLARAFQSAGARAVVASRWPVRDDEAEELIDRVYERLAAGDRLGEALRAARADAWRRGRPAAAWAAFVLLGEADFAPFAGLELAGGASRRRRLVLAVLAAAALAAFLLVRSRRGRSRTEA